ncbi:hypothetical protein BDZ45DRAFT_697722 [Acephala macrosclerotiorum]|nr:hypothetical protein BDZ45DRAFT_697722 [Acephala macrosclerotiorum]
MGTLQPFRDIGVDPRKPKNALTRDDTAAIGNFIDDENIDQEDKGALWPDIAEMVGVDLPKTQHFKPLGFREVDSQTIQRACKRDEKIINAVCHEEKELPQKQADQRYDFAGDQLKERPHSVNWKDVYFCDEFHFGVGTQTTRRIKRRMDRKHRDAATNVYRKVTSKDTKAKA